VAASLGVPVFVSTPDLLEDLPEAVWCPVVVDIDRWATTRLPFELDRLPVVVHAPSSAAVKGSALIEPAMRRLDDAGLIEYRRLTDVPSAAMPTAIADADIVLDQFRIGSYGVAACEAMAARRVVVGYVSDAVRSRVRRATGAEVPIVEADADSIESVVRSLIDDPDGSRRAARLGRDFVVDLHGGARSSAALVDAWIRR
jgi:hypothetical protein